MSAPLRLFSLSAVLFGASAVAAAQSTLWSSLGPSAGAQYGRAVANAGDVDQDGVDDYVVGAPGDSSAGPGHGSARVYSGATGAELWAFHGTLPLEFVGTSVDGVGDVDGDGYDDVLIGSHEELAWVCSGVDGAVIHEVPGLNEGDLFGATVSGVGDVDGDGYADFAIGAHYADTAETRAGKVVLFSGLDASVLDVFGGAGPLDSFGWSIDGAGDVDGDGYDDFVAGALNGGYAKVFSGRTRDVLHVLAEPDPDFQFGSAVAGVGDVDGDGYADLLVGARPSLLGMILGAGPGYAEVRSGWDGSTMATLTGFDPFGEFGSAVGSAGDANGDGTVDYWVGAPAAGAPLPGAAGQQAGALHVFSGADESLLYSAFGRSAFGGLGVSAAWIGDQNEDGYDDVLVGAPRRVSGAGDLTGEVRVLAVAMVPDLGSMSAFFGGRQSLELVAGPENAGLTYWMAGSATGTSPGVDFGGVLLPLAPDAYWNITLTKPFGTPIEDPIGVLDADGRASAAFEILPGQLPELAGTTLYHAYTVLDPTLKVVFASNPVPITFQ